MTEVNHRIKRNHRCATTLRQCLQLGCMRNIFDQYDHAENRLTHGLMCTLASDRPLLDRFILWTTGVSVRGRVLDVLEQSLPGEEEPTDEDEAERRGLPDGWIHDRGTWALVIESKIQSPLTVDQLQRHRRTAERRGFRELFVPALVIETPGPFDIEGITIKKWTEVYTWMLGQRSSECTDQFTSYMEISKED